MFFPPLKQAGGLGLAVLLTTASLLSTGCSLGVLDYRPCDESADCRAVFGRGFICGEAGFCEQTEPLNRCSSHPADLLDNLSEYEDWILLGSLFDQNDFEVVLKSARLAVIHVNTRDGLDGTPFGIIECTNQANVIYDDLDENRATALAGYYLSEGLGIPTIIGPATTTRTEIAYNNDSPLGTLHISPSATSTDLTDIDGSTSTDEDPGLLWRTAPPDSLQGQVLALEMKAQGVHRVGIVAQVGGYGEGLAEVFQQNYDSEEGYESELRLFEEASELGPHITYFNSADFDGVLVISSNTSDMAAFLNGASAEELDYDDQKLIFLPDGANDVQLIKEANNAVALFDDIRGTVPATPSGLAYNNFVAGYRLEFDGEDPSDFGFSAHAYDAGWLAIAGAAWSRYQEGGAITGLGTARGLRQLSDSSAETIDLSQTHWLSISAALEEGSGVDVTGASGALNFDALSGELTTPVDVWRILCEDPTDSNSCSIEAIYCVDVSENPSPDCCQPGVDCPEEPDEDEGTED
ncbi:MAG: hypothetical protein VX498_08480 [Myxococcota bacterium]|nr:hypothetical protein [Myxococcota bacterium]